jgi:prephenate dehydrogenase
MAIRSKGDSKVVGYDAENSAQTLAQRMGAVDSVEWNIDKAVENADVVIVATPAGSLYDVFDGISRHLKDGAVVTDTSPAKRAVMEWAKDLLPSNVGYVGGNPLTGASIREQKEASGYIFHNAKWAVVTPSTADSRSIKAVTDLIESVGAKPVFMDAHEHDSFSAATSGLPAVVSAAVMNAVSTSPSWAEISRFVGGDFDNITSPASGDPASSQSAAATNADMLVYWIDQLIERFQAIKAGLEDDEARFASDGPLAESFIQAWEQRARLEAGVADRHPNTDERAPIPSSSESMMGLFFGSRVAKVMGRGPDKKKDTTKYDRRRMK